MDKEILYTIDRYEGGLTDDPADKGGLTKYGISKKYFPNIDIVNLSKEHAVSIYGQNYFLPLKLNEIKSVRIRWKVFDIGVNNGPGTAAKMLQKAIGTEDDGIIGDVTISKTNTLALSAVGENDILNRLVDQQVMRYCEIVKKDASQLVFLIGWIKRAQDRGMNLI